MIRSRQLRRAKTLAVSAARAVFLIAFSFILVYPILFMLSNAVKTQSDLMTPAVQWISRNPTLFSFTYAFEAMQYPTALKNTVVFELVSAAIEVFSCAVAAYGLARFDVPLKRLLTAFLFLTILVPDIILVIPRLSNFRYLDFCGILGGLSKLFGTELRPNLTDTPWAFWLPSLVGVGLKGGLFIFIYMQFFKGLPGELEEAAWIDGAGPVRTFVRIILPSSGVALLTVTIFSVVWHWNDWLYATMYTVNNRTLAAVLYNIDQVIIQWRNASGQEMNSELSYGIPLAACLLYITPPVVMYLFLQKKFIQSIDRVGIVG